MHAVMYIAETKATLHLLGSFFSSVSCISCYSIPFCPLPSHFSFNFWKISSSSTKWISLPLLDHKNSVSKQWMCHLHTHTWVCVYVCVYACSKSKKRLTSQKTETTHFSPWNDKPREWGDGDKVSSFTFFTPRAAHALSMHRNPREGSGLLLGMELGIWASPCNRDLWGCGDPADYMCYRSCSTFKLSQLISQFWWCLSIYIWYYRNCVSICSKRL